VTLQTFRVKRSRGQRSRSQRDITTAKISKVINYSAADCSILLRFVTDFDHVTADVLRTFKVRCQKGQGHSVKASSDRRIISPFLEIWYLGS